MIKFDNDWDGLLAGEFTKDYYLRLRGFLKSEYASRPIYPPMGDIYSALRATSRENTKIVILGQDPYHEEGQAHGMAFSVRPGVRIPPSLMNIYKELRADLGCSIPQSGCLEKWAHQGVLLLNAVLTVAGGAANSHRGKGWEILTDKVVELVNKKETPVVFMLWGRNAREKKALITNPIHLVLEAPHPSPLSASGGFFGCRHFSKANAFLEKTGQSPIDWQIE